MTQHKVVYQMLISQLEQSNRQNEVLAEKLAELTQQVCDLTKKIEQLTRKNKDSHNSSKPPSSDG